MTAAHELDAVDELCRLAVAARRLGCGIHLTDVEPDLRELLELAGVGDVLGRCPAGEQPDVRGDDEGDLR